MTRQKPAWTREPILWDDHSQPLCKTQAEEDALLDELAHAEARGWLTSGEPPIDSALVDSDEPPF